MRAGFLFCAIIMLLLAGVAGAQSRIEGSAVGLDGSPLAGATVLLEAPGVKVPLSTTGKVRSFTIVHRASRGIPTPYVSALIDIDDDGGTVKTNIVNTEPTPEKVTLGMKVRLATFVADTDSQGTEAVAFGFEPAA